MTTFKKIVITLCAAVGVVSSSFATWQAGLQWGAISGSSINKTDFPAVTNFSLTVDKAMADGWPTQTTYVYWGQIYLDGSAYRFGESIDDEAMLKIQGVTVFNNSTWNAASFGTVELPAGWYDFELRMCNKTQGGGPNSYGGFSSTKGFGFAKGTREEMDALKSGASFEIPADSGDASFLRYDDGLGFLDTVTVRAFPYDVDAVVPAYGVTNKLSDGDTIAFSAPEEVVLDEGTIVFTGCRIYDVDIVTNKKTENENSPVTTEVVDGRRVFTYTHGATMREAMWEWKWTKVDVIAECVPSYGGTVTGGGEDCSTGESVTLEAKANLSSSFVRWEGDLPEGVDATKAKISFTPTKPLSLRAVFETAHYVTADAPAVGAGTSWSNPTSLTNAFAKALPGDTLYLKAGVYALSNTVTIADAEFTVVGGLLGETDGDTTTKDKNVTTILQGCGAKMKTALRLFTISSSTVNFKDVTFTGGYKMNGAGIYVTESDLAFDSCSITNNFAEGCERGAGIYQNGGSITMRDSLFENNYYTYGSPGASLGGAGAAFVNTTAYLTNTVFRKNYGIVGAYSAKGGAISQSGGTLKIEDCVFEGNYSYNNSTVNTTDRRCFGGALYLVNAEVDVVRSLFERNYTFDQWASGHQTTSEKSGGVVYQSGGTVLFERCIFDKNGYRISGADVRDKGSITVASGTMRLKNVLIANGKGNAVESLGSDAVVVLENCTIADYMKYDFGGVNSPYTRANGSALYTEKGTINVTNSVLWGCENGDVCNFEGNGIVDINYTLLASEDNKGLGVNNIVGDPLFVDTEHYHLSSAAGAYTNGWFEGGEWIYTEATSPAIDKADKSALYANEPQPNNYRANLGAYGNTTVASKSVLGDDPVVEEALRVFTYPPVVGASSAVIYGDIGPAGKTAKITIVMDSEDKGTASIADWANPYEITSVAAWTKFSKEIIGLSGSNTYRIVAESDGETAWSSPAVTFSMSSLPTPSAPAISELMRKQARIKGSLINDGGAATTMTFSYWVNEGEETTIALNGGAAVETGYAYDEMLTGLAAGAEYTYAIKAENSVGIVAITNTFTTIAATPREWFISKEANGLADGTSFANGSMSLNTVAENFESGDVVYLESGEYIIGSQIELDGKENITFKGGCNKDDYAVQDGITTFVGDPTKATRRHAKITNSTVTFDRIIFTKGYIGDGNAVYATKSDLTFTDCILSNNHYDSGSGGAIYLGGGKLSLLRTAFNLNRLRGNGSKGGAIYASNAELYIEGATFTTNYLRAQWHGMSGGAIYMTGSTAFVKDSYFAGNAIAQNDWYTQNYAHEHGGGSRRAEGGTFFLSSASQLDIVDSTFVEGFVGYITTDANRTDKVGGILFVDGNSKAVINRTAFHKTGVHGGGLFLASDGARIVKVDDKGSLTVCQGSLYMTNVVMSACKGNGVETLTANAHAEIVNCTLAGFTGAKQDGYPFSEYTGYALYQEGGAITVKNSILWGNKNGNYYNHNGGGTMAATYTLGQTLLDGEGNISEDPKFYDDKYCHLRSFAGVYTGDWFGDNGKWVTTKRKENSPAIDAGDPASDHSLEPMPRGMRINLGAYGNTKVASKTSPKGLYIIVR